MFRSLLFIATGHDIFDFYIVLCYCTCSDLYNVIVRMNVTESKFKLTCLGVYNVSMKLQGSWVTLLLVYNLRTGVPAQTRGNKRFEVSIFLYVGNI